MFYSYEKEGPSTQQAHDVGMTSQRRRCDLMASHSRMCDVKTKSYDPFKKGVKTENHRVAKSIPIHIKKECMYSLAAEKSFKIAGFKRINVYPMSIP